MKVKEFLEKKGIIVEIDGRYYFRCNYKGNKIILQRNDALNYCYTLYINDKTIMTRAYIRTCVSKILNLKELN